jgi:Mrp family chromosome partitioning ATPase
MNETTDAAAIFAPLWKRKWMILIVALLVGAASYAYYKRQPAVYSATTQLNLASGSEEQGSAGPAGKAGSVSKSALSNAATIITSSLVAEEAHKLLRAEHIKAKGKVRAKTSATGSDIVTITAEANGAKRAAALANAYAAAYIKRQRAAYVRSIKTAITNTHQQLRRIELAALSAQKSKGSKGASGNSSTAVIQAASLSTKLNQLESQLSLQGIQQISPAKPKTAQLVEPQPKKNAIFGFALGALLAALAAFFAERFDHSLRSLSRLEPIFGSRILTALPSVRRPIIHTDGRPAPSRPLLEPLRRAHTTLGLSATPGFEGGDSRVILCTSPEAGDGKSTVVAALALVKREAGERVAVIEANWRRPVLARSLDVNPEPGLADALTGRLPLDAVIQSVPAASRSATSEQEDVSTDGGSTLVRTRTGRAISVLVGGASDGNPPSLADRGFTDLLGSLSGEHDCILIDAPSPLEASEAMPLLGAVDGIIVIVRLGHTRDVSAARLAELLELPSTAPLLGVVANDVSRRELARSGLSAGSTTRRRSRLPWR